MQQPSACTALICRRGCPDPSLSTSGVCVLVAAWEHCTGRSTGCLGPLTCGAAGVWQSIHCTTLLPMGTPHGPGAPAPHSAAPEPDPPAHGPGCTGQDAGAGQDALCCCALPHGPSAPHCTLSAPRALPAPHSDHPMGATPPPPASGSLWVSPVLAPSSEVVPETFPPSSSLICICSRSKGDLRGKFLLCTVQRCPALQKLPHSLPCLQAELFH